MPAFSGLGSFTNRSAQLPQTTCPQGFANIALELFVSSFLQLGHILIVSSVLESLSSVKKTVTSVFNEYVCLVDGVLAGHSGASFSGFARFAPCPFASDTSTPGIQKLASVFPPSSPPFALPVAIKSPPCIS